MPSDVRSELWSWVYGGCQRAYNEIPIFSVAEESEQETSGGDGNSGGQNNKNTIAPPECIVKWVVRSLLPCFSII